MSHDIIPDLTTTDPAATSAVAVLPARAVIVAAGTQPNTVLAREDGRIRLGNQKDAGDDDVIGRIRDVINARSSGDSSLESFAVRNARMGLNDEVTGLHLTSTRANLVLSAKGQTIGTTFDADVTFSGRTAQVSADFILPPGNGPVSGKATFTGLDLRGLGANASPARFPGCRTPRWRIGSRRRGRAWRPPSRHGRRSCGRPTPRYPTRSAYGGAPRIVCAICWRTIH